MIPYIVVFFIVISILYKQDFCKRDKIKTKLILLSITILVLFAGLRSLGVGTDTLVYIEPYIQRAKYIKNIIQIFTYDNFLLDKGYLFLSYIGLFVTDKPWILLTLTHLIIISFTFLGLKELSCLYKFKWWIFMFIYLFLFYNLSLNMLRQSCALSVLFFSFALAMNRKFYIAIILFLFAYTLHSSAILGLIPIAIYYICLIPNKTYRYVFLFSLLIVGFLIYSSFFEYLNNISSYSLINERYINAYGANSSIKGLNSLPKTDIINILFIYYILFLSRRKKLIDSVEFEFGLSVNSAYLLCFMLGTYVTFLIRVSYYFYLISFFIVAYCMSNSKFSKKVRYSYFTFLVLQWWYISIYLGANETYPYSSEILGI